MRGVVIFLVIVIVVGGIAYFGALKFINTKGKDIVAGYIKKSFNTDVKIGTLYFRFPLNIEIKDFSCQDIAFSRANVFGGFYNPFTQQLVLNSIVIEGADVKIHKDKTKVYIKPVYPMDNLSKEIKVSGKRGFIMPSAFAQENQGTATKEGQKQFAFKIGSLAVKDARAQFIDSTLRPAAVFNFEGIELKMYNFEYPRLGKFKIKLNTAVRTDSVKKGNTIDISGWVDYFYKNMNVNVAVDDIDGYTFNGYYPPFWKLEKFGVKDATLALTANLNSQNNDLVIDSTVSLEKINFFEETEEVCDRIKYLKTVIALLQGANDKVAINMKLKTKMDSPRLDFASVKDSFKGVFNIGAASVVGNIIGTITKAGDDASSGEGSAEQGMDKTVEKIKDVVDTIKDLF